jgi:hypothetical protein
MLLAADLKMSVREKGLKEYIRREGTIVVGCEWKKSLPSILAIMSFSYKVVYFFVDVIFRSGFFRLLFLRVDCECNRPSFLGVR